MSRGSVALPITTTDWSRAIIRTSVKLGSDLHHCQHAIEDYSSGQVSARGTTLVRNTEWAGLDCKVLECLPCPQVVLSYSPFRIVESKTEMGFQASGDAPCERKWPVKIQELQNHTIDSRVWNGFSFRDDDIVIASWAKSGTTWMQQIISQLVATKSDHINLHAISPWPDLRIAPDEPILAALEAQTHRRFIKTHLPVDALVYNPKAKYILVARDGRDTMWSMHNQYLKATDVFYRAVNDTPGRLGPALKRPSENPVQYFREFLEDDADMSKTHSPFWRHIRGWWDIRELPNLLLVHYNDLKADKKREIKRIAEFLDIAVPEEKWANILRRTSFEYMKENAVAMSPPGAEVLLEDGAKTFINRGSNGRWVGKLSEEDVSRYEAKARTELGTECAEWLAIGRSAW